MNEYIQDIDIIIEAVNNGDKEDAVQMLKEFQKEFKTSFILNLN